MNARGAIGLNTELPPSAQRLHEIHQQIEDEKIKCVFAEVGTNSAIIDTLQRDTKIHIGFLDTLGNGHDFDDYLELLRFDAHALRVCL